MEPKHGCFPSVKLHLKSHIAQNMWFKCAVSSDFWFVSNNLSFPSVICVDKRDGG